MAQGDKMHDYRECRNEVATSSGARGGATSNRRGTRRRSSTTSFIAVVSLGGMQAFYSHPSSTRRGACRSWPLGWPRLKRAAHLDIPSAAFAPGLAGCYVAGAPSQRNC